MPLVIGWRNIPVHDTLSSWRGFLGTVRATFSSTYKDDEALAMLKEVAHPVHAYNPLVQIADVEPPIHVTASAGTLPG